MSIVSPSTETRAPATLPICISRPSALAPLRIVAPSAAAVRTMVRTSRASSVRASKYISPPLRFSARSVGACARTSGTVSRWWSLPIRQPPTRSYVHSRPSKPLARRASKMPSFSRIGKRNGSRCTRCGAFLRKRWRSRSEWRTRLTLPCSMYRRPPCTIFEDFDDVPEAKSSFSTSAARSPREAASSTAYAPVMPPPMTRTSYVSSASRRLRAARSSSRGVRRVAAALRRGFRAGIVITTSTPGVSVRRPLGRVRAASATVGGRQWGVRGSGLVRGSSAGRSGG